MAKNKNRYKPESWKVYPFPLTELVQCGDCGKSLGGKSGTGRKEKHHYYGHPQIKNPFQKEKPHDCQVKNVRAPRLEEIVTKSLRSLLSDPSMIEKWIAIYKSKTSTELPDVQNQAKKLDQEVQTTSKRISNLVQRISELPSEVPADAFYEQIKQMTAKLNDLECRRFTINGKTLKRQKSMWVDPRRDDSPIRLETTNNGQIQNETTFTYPAKPADGIWFPATIQQRLVWKNESINNYTIELAEFNQRISDTVFSYGGLGLLDDLPVLIDGPGDVMKAPRLRDGKVVYPETKGAGSRDMPPPFMAVPDHMPSSWWSRLPYIAGALLFALIGVTLLRKMVWRLRA